MSLSISRILPNASAVKLSCLSLLALTVSVPSVWAQAPAVLADAQKTLNSGLNGPQAFAVNSTNNGAIFIADTNNNQIVALVNGNNFAFNPPGFTLVTPQAIALDAQGDLFIGDTPSNNGNSYGRIIEMPASGGNLTGTAQLVFSGAPLANPISMTVDNTGTLFIGDYPLSTGNGAIYSLAPGATTLTPLTFAGTPPTLIPAALVRDASTNLYIADNGSMDGGLYIAPDTGGTATPISTPNFTINQPSGLALDAAGNLYILSLLGVSPRQQVLVLPAASPSTPYILPNTGIGASSALSFDATGNLDVLSSQDGGIYQLSFGSPINMGYASAAFPGIPIIFNFEFNAPATLRGFRIVTGGDVSTELTQTSGGSCVNGAHNNLTPAAPYTCQETYEATPSYPGLRDSSILVRGTAGAILASVPVYQIGAGGVQVTYPLAATTTASGLQEPQAVAISGLNKTVYVADTAAGMVYSTGGLGSSTLTPVSTGTITLVAPSALAVDGAGNLFIADFGGDNPGQVIEVPTTTGAAPSVVNTGTLLQHPIAITADTLGNLYIGDAGPGGLDAGTGNPGYLVKVPAVGAAFKLNTPTVPIVFPQALTVDFYTGFLFIGDGGDTSGVGQVDVVTADGTVGGPVALPNVTNPTGLAFDPAGNLYVLDGIANTITVDPIYINNPTPYLLSFDNTLLASASSMAISAGGQSFVIANIGTGANNNLVYLNGNKATLKFGNVKVGTQSPLMTATVANIGNATMTLGTPYYSSTTSNSAFSILNSTRCTNNLGLASGGSCSINFEFTPSALGQTSQQFTINSNAFNTGIPVLTVQGTGTAGGAVVKKSKN
jgi:sugar lactone lactonase YvrE